MSVVTVTASAFVTPSLVGQEVLPRGSNKPGSMSVNLERRWRFDSYKEIEILWQWHHKWIVVSYSCIFKQGHFHARDANRSFLKANFQS